MILWQPFPKLWQLRSNIKYKGWNDCGVSGRVSEMFAAHTIDPSRVEFLALRRMPNCWQNTSALIGPSIRFPISGADA